MSVPVFVVAANEVLFRSWFSQLAFKVETICDLYLSCCPYTKIFSPYNFRNSSINNQFSILQSGIAIICYMFI